MSENVIIADASFVDSVAFDLIVNFERMLERRARSLVHTYSRTKVCWKIFRRPPDIEDLPY